MIYKSDVLYEDNHLIAVNKKAGVLTQRDNTGDTPLAQQVKDYLKIKYNKQGNAFVGILHRLDRPVSGVIIFAKTSKALSRMNMLLREGKCEKQYLAIIEKCNMPQRGMINNYLIKNKIQNKSYITKNNVTNQNAKKGILEFQKIREYVNYIKLRIRLHTGRHHQIRVQLSHRFSPIKGDLKYGAKRSLENGCILLHSFEFGFIHPIKKESIKIKCPIPNNIFWRPFIN